MLVLYSIPHTTVTRGDVLAAVQQVAAAVEPGEVEAGLESPAQLLAELRAVLVLEPLHRVLRDGAGLTIREL